MATYARIIRRGLPRVPGGPLWPDTPDAIAVSTDASAVAPGEPVAAAGTADAIAADAVAAVGTAAVAPAVTPTAANPATAPAATSVRVRSGLPRTPGGSPWPNASEVVAAAAHAGVSAAATAGPAVEPGGGVEATPALLAATAPAASPVTEGTPLRRGLARTPGGEPWPAAGLVAASVVEPALVAEPAPTAGTTAPIAAAATASAAAASNSAPAATASAVAAFDSAPAATGNAAVRAPLAFTRTSWQGRAAAEYVAPVAPTRIGPFTRAQWAGTTLLGGITLLILAGMAVALVRFLLSTDALRSFVATYPGEYHLPEGAPVGFPGWLGWQHFFNMFLMVLIIRTGLQVRRDKRPSAFWTPKGQKKGKISLSLWFHQSLDLLWVLNGVIFIVLLFVSGQWMRVIPTSWAVFPNALSAVLQYISLDWPTENGWVNYNAVQQLAYFSVIFLAAPLAAATGIRMSGLWPKNATALTRAYPVEWARALHFPVMLFFVLFIFVHVVLVFATGALRNLNHMYAAQGAVDPSAYADNWLGFWLFFASIVTVIVAWIAARPLVLAPIARLFGTVSMR